MIDEGPIPAIHGVVRWQLVDLCQWIFVEFRITLSPQTLSRELREWAFASSQPTLAIMRRRMARSRILKKLPRPSGRAIAHEKGVDARAT